MPKKPRASENFESLLTSYGDACLNAATADCTGAPKAEIKDRQRQVFEARDAVVAFVVRLEAR